MVLRPNIFLLLSAILLIAGCETEAEWDSKEALEAMAGGKLKETVSVSGTVSVNGAPAAGVNIFAYTPSGMKPAVETRTEVDGTYCWSTYTACDGLPPGKYRLAFTHVPKEGKGQKEGLDLFEGKYRDPEESDFTLEVKSGAPQTEVNYKLECNSPFYERTRIPRPQLACRVVGIFRA